MNKISVKRYYETPEESINIISVSVFLLENAYKNIDKYYYGLLDLVKYVPVYFPDFYLRIYYDSTITKAKHKNEELNKYVLEKWKPLIKRIKNLEHIQLVKYYSEHFRQDDIYHHGLFGTLVRFIPLFDYAENNTNVVFVADIDTSQLLLKEKRKIYDIFINSPSQFHFQTRYCYHTQPRFESINKFLSEEYKTNVRFRINAGSIFSIFKFPKYLFEDFINCLIDLEQKECKYINAFKESYHPDYLTESKLSIFQKTILSYGIDEFFLNTTFLKYIEANKIPFSYTILNDLKHPFYHIYIRNDHFKNPSQDLVKLFKNIMGKYYYNEQTLKENYDFFDNIIYHAGKFSKPENKKYYEYFFYNTKRIFNELNQTGDYYKYKLTEEEIKCVLSHKNPYGEIFVMHEY